MAGNLVPELHTHGLGNNEQYGVGNENRIDQQAKGVMPPCVFELQVGDAGDAARQSTAGTWQSETPTKPAYRNFESIRRQEDRQCQCH